MIAVYAIVDYASSYVFRGATVNEGAAIQAGMDTSISWFRSWSMGFLRC